MSSMPPRVPKPTSRKTGSSVNASCNDQGCRHRPRRSDIATIACRIAAASRPRRGTCLPLSCTSACTSAPCCRRVLASERHRCLAPARPQANTWNDTDPRSADRCIPRTIGSLMQVSCLHRVESRSKETQGICSSLEPPMWSTFGVRVVAKAPSSDARWSS